MIRIGASLRVPLAHLDAESLRELRGAATVRLDTRPGQAEQRRDLSRLDGDTLVLPRGMASDVRRALPAGATWSDGTVRAPASFVARVPWRPQQAELAATFADRVQGIALAATGAGKTGAAFALAERVGQRILVLVPTVALASQWADEARRFLGVEAGVCAEGTWTDADIVIATPGAADANRAKLANFGLLVADECQNFATELRASILASIPARWRVGLTATLPGDHRGDVLRRLFGPVQFRYAVDAGIADGVLASPSYVRVPTSFWFDYRSTADWPPLQEALVTDDARNALIVRTVQERCAGRTTLVLSTRLAHLEALRERFGAEGIRVAVLTGKTKPKDRAAILASARSGELDVLLGSNVADEGLDVPSLGALVLAGPSKSEGRLLQRIGRVIRSTPGKPAPLVLDMVDSAGPLANQARRRKEAFEKAFGKAVDS